MRRDYHRFDAHLPDRGLWAVAVPWHLVPLVARSEAMRQVAATGYADSATRQACLILWPGVDPQWVSNLIERLDHAYRARQRAGRRAA